MNELVALWKGSSLREKAIVVVGLLYLLSPLDLIPEVILGPLGLLDDGGALIVILLTLVTVHNRIKTHLRTIEGEVIPPKTDTKQG